jgi:hypothetical protein
MYAIYAHQTAGLQDTNAQHAPLAPSLSLLEPALAVLAFVLLGDSFRHCSKAAPQLDKGEVYL